MRKDEGKIFINLLIAIIVFALLIVVGINWANSKDGIYTKVTKDEKKYSKSEVLEEINVIITQKYLEVYKKATAEGKNKIEEFYDAEKVMAYLSGYTCNEKGEINFNAPPTEVVYIEKLKSSKDCYYVNISNFKRDITSYGMGKNEENSNDYFYIKKVENSYKLFYKDSNMEDDEIGDLQIEQKI